MAATTLSIGTTIRPFFSHRAIYLQPISAVKAPKKIKKIGSEISSLTLRRSQHPCRLRSRKVRCFNTLFSACSPPLLLLPLTLGEVVAAVDKQTKFDVVINEIPPSSPIAVIKAITAMTSLSLKESKKLMEDFQKKVKEGSVTKDEAEEAKKQLEEAGAYVSIV
ncbi:hypothetical protein CARUB_v10019453mg [Capsella rubella]|uniref:Large ribosomal subunit protein bL12 C-terminal domain-containing protein n=1 Tax=Capsella rubella TaxID=81985 RepID=R0HE80_9BRAS|nr:hypothetical protein CARUB_v10019453mg [Capsella rubella]